MPTRNDLATRIADDLVDAPVTSAQISAAIDDAIEYYTPQRFHFNEAHGFSCTFSSSVDTVSLGALTTYFAKIDRLCIRDSDVTTDVSELKPVDYASLMDDQDTRTLCRPINYCIYGDSILFDSRADQNYTGIIDGIRRLTPTNSYCLSSSVAWFVDAKNLVRYRAEGDLLANIARDDEEAQKKYVLAEEQFKALRQRMNTRNSGRIRPTQF